MENESQPETQSNAPPESITTVCLNCGKVFEGNYCPQCGQSAQTGCFTFKFLIENLIAAFVGKDGGFWFTFKNLFTRPGGMIVEILNGKRKRYFSPFPLLFFTLTLYILVFTFTGSRTTYYLDEKEEEEIMAELEEAPDESSEVGRSLYPFLFKCLRFYNNHYTACYMLTLPLMVIAARQAFGKQNKKRYNRTEYTIALVYSMVMVVLFRCVVSVLYLCSPPIVRTNWPLHHRGVLPLDSSLFQDHDGV